MNGIHTWKFFRAGGFDQVRIETGADIVSLDQLDQKLWVALACPTTGLEFDARTLGIIDTDKDGRVRAPEVIAAGKWAGKCLKNPNDLVKGAGTLSLTAINDLDPEGKQLLASAKQILINLGKPDATEISVEDTMDTARIFAQTQFNGDGIIPPDSAKDAALQAAITDIIACVGAETDRSGKPGLNQAKLDLFFSEAQAYAEWWKKAESDANVWHLKEMTECAASALKAVRGKVEDYFTRCRVVAYDSRSAGALNRDEKEYAMIAGKDLAMNSQEIAAFPLAQAAGGKPLPLAEGLNPAWADAISRFNKEIISPLLGAKTSLNEADWQNVLSRFAAYEAWITAKPPTSVEKLGIVRIREILSGKAKEMIIGLLAQDKALEPEANSIASVDRLVRYHRDLFKLLNNFVSFREFYSRRAKAIFQAGVLYLDQRSCELCLVVEDAGRHALMAGLAGTYLAYCDCVRKATGEKLSIVAAFTDGDSDNLMVGRNGIFYDRKGRDWDATITKIIDNPISIRQAFWAPYKKLVRAIEEQVAKRAAAADAQSSANLQAAAAATAAGTPPPVTEPKKIDTGTLAAIGLVLSTLLGALGVIFAKILGLPAWQWPLAVIGILLAISLPSMLLAWLKLRKRNLGPILDANGWAVNARARMNVPFGKALTGVPNLPPGSQRDLVDPFAEKRRPWWLYITLIVILLAAFAWYRGKLDQALPAKLKSTTVMGTNAPAYTPGPAMTVTNVPAPPSAPAK